VKALVISISILLVAFFIFAPAFGQPPEDKPAQSVEQEEKPAKEPEHKKTADANVIADPNAVRTEIKKFDGLDDELEKINAKSGNETSEWTRGRTDDKDKMDLASAVQQQITAELKFLREIAAKEGAAETTAAIDGILLDRQERFKEVTEKLEKEAERNRRRAEIEEKKAREREMRERNSGRSRERDRTRRDSQ
jgi:hypothetical protein